MTAAAPATATGLTSDELAAFRERGWVIRRGLFAPDRIRLLGQEIDDLHERLRQEIPPGVNVTWEDLPSGQQPRILEAMNSELVSPTLAAMSRSEEILAAMRQLIGPDLYLYHSKLLMKPAGVGGPIPWHQDWGYWQHGSRLPVQVNCQVAIDGADAANGALRFVDGSHLGGAIGHDRLARNFFHMVLGQDIEDRASTLVAMQPGDAVFFGSLVVHGSGANRSSRHRRANTFAYDRARNQQQGELPDANWRSGRRD
jgi:ectoine hydroxylase-related dioxygenase (phytanoyl-CoA dioxygenase family)